MLARGFEIYQDREKEIHNAIRKDRIDIEEKALEDLKKQINKTAYLSDAAKLARRQRGEEKRCPRQRARKLEHCAAVPARMKRGGSFCTNFSSFPIQFLCPLGAVLARWII